MMKKRAKKKTTNKKVIAESPKRRSGKKKHKDVAKVREEIADIVKDNAGKIAVALVDQATHGQSAQAKYLFEVAKIFPAVEGEEATQEEDSLAKMLFEKLQPPKKKAEEESDDGEEDTAGADAVKKNEGEEAPANAGEKPPLLATEARIGVAGVEKIPTKERSTVEV